MNDIATSPPKPGSGLSITALVLGIIGLIVPLLGIAALVCGIIGLKNQGRGMAIAGIVLGSLGILTSCAILPALLMPAITGAMTEARKVQAGNNMRQIGLAMRAYMNEHDAGYPKDLEELRSPDYGLSRKVFTSPGHPEITQPFCYVRPIATAGRNQPILVQDPACNRGKGSGVLYADVRFAFVKGTALWTEAQRLSVLPKAQDKGIELADWTVDGQTGKPIIQAPINAAPVAP